MPSGNPPCIPHLEPLCRFHLLTCAAPDSSTDRMLLAGSHLLLGMSTGFLITITVFLFQKYILVYFYIYLVFFGGVLFLFF